MVHVWREEVWAAEGDVWQVVVTEAWSAQKREITKLPRLFLNGTEYDAATNDQPNT